MHRLAFLSVEIHDHNIVEVVPRAGVEITLEKVKKFFEYLSLNGIEGNVSILINKVTKYSYDFQSLVALSVETRIKSIAVVAYDQLSTETSKFRMQRFNKSGKKIEIFCNRDDAMAWLKKEQ